MSCNIVQEATIIFNLYKSREEFLLFLCGCGSTISNSTSTRAFEQVFVGTRVMSDRPGCRTIFPEKNVLLFCDVFLDHGIYRGQTNVA